MNKEVPVKIIAVVFINARKKQFEIQLPALPATKEGDFYGRLVLQRDKFYPSEQYPMTKEFKETLAFSFPETYAKLIMEGGAGIIGIYIEPEENKILHISIEDKSAFIVE